MRLRGIYHFATLETIARMSDSLTLPADAPCTADSFSLRLLPSALAFVITWIVFAPFARIGIDIHHDGIMLKPALDVLSGQTLHRDTFTQYGSLTTYVHAFFLLLFGPTLLTLKLATVGMYALASAILVRAWRTILPLHLTALAFFMWLAFAYFYIPFVGRTMLIWSSVLALPIQALALLCLMSVLRGDRVALHSCVAGVCAGLVYWCRMPVGITLFAALIMSLTLIPMLERKPVNWRSVLLTCAGTASVFFVFFAYFIYAGALGEWYYQTIEWPTAWVKTRTSVFDSLFPRPKRGAQIIILTVLAMLPALLARLKIQRLEHVRAGIKIVALITWYGLLAQYIYERQEDMEDSLYSGWSILIPVSMTAFFFAGSILALLRRTFSTLDRMAMGACILAVASYSQFYPVPCTRHIYWGLAPAFGPFLYVLLRAAGGRAVFVFVSAGLLLAPMVYHQSLFAMKNLSADYVTLDSPALVAGMRVERDTAALIGDMNAVFSRAPEKAVVLEGHDAFWAAFTENRENPGPFFVTWEFSRLKEIRAQHIAFVKARLPFVVLQTRDAELEKTLIELKYSFPDVFVTPPKEPRTLRVAVPPDVSLKP